MDVGQEIKLWTLNKINEQYIVKNSKRIVRNSDNSIKKIK